MSEMIECVAKAMYTKMISRMANDEPDTHQIDWNAWEAQGDKLRDDWRQTARDGIAALREPTEAMERAAFASAKQWGPVQVWEDMIDAILKDH